jgi:hypothetical protein
MKFRKNVIIFNIKVTYLHIHIILADYNDRYKHNFSVAAENRHYEILQSRIAVANVNKGGAGNGCE